MLRFLKSVFFVALALSMAFSLAGYNSVHAQGGLIWQSGVQVVNLDATTDATVELTFYSTADGSVAATINDTIPMGRSKTYFGASMTGVPAGFKGSLVVESTVLVTAIANTVTNDFAYGDSSTSFAAGGTTFNLPLIMCNNSGFNTSFSVQNAGVDPANIIITYTPGSAGATGVTETATITAGASKFFDQESGSSTKNCTQLGGTTGKFIGSAAITSDQPVVATVMQLGSGTSKTLLNYNGFAQGSTHVSLPLVMANNSGYFTGFQIMNVGTATTTLTITFTTNVVSGMVPPTPETVDLAGGASITRIQSGGVWTGKYVGGAVIISDGQPLVVIVNQLGPGKGSAHQGVDPAAATANIAAPLIMANNSGFNTAIQIQNVGPACPSITVTYSAYGTLTPAAATITDLASGSSKTVFQSGGAWASLGKYIGSAQIAAPGCTVIAIVNQLGTGTGDNLFTYNAYNY